MEIRIHFPDTDEGLEVLKERISQAHADSIAAYIFSLKCDEETAFFKDFNLTCPLVVQHSLEQYDFHLRPPWADNAIIQFYDKRQFRAKIYVKLKGQLSHCFSVAACDYEYQGYFADQLKRFLTNRSGKSDYFVENCYS